MGTKIGHNSDFVRGNNSIKKLYPCVRFVPKRISMRAITNMKSNSYNIPPPGNNEYAQSSAVLPYTLTNSSLYNVLYILKYLYQNHHPSACGFGVSGVEEACRRLKIFRLFNEIYKKKGGGLDASKEEQKCDGVDQSQPFYIAVLDLEKCFDRVIVAKMYDVVQEIVTENPVSQKNTNISQNCEPRPDLSLVEHLVHKYKVSLYLPSVEKFVCRSVRSVAAGDDFRSFHETSKFLAESHYNAVINDEVVYPSLSRDDLLKIVRQHLFQHAVRLPEGSQKGKSETELYTQVRGIPQGSALSPLFCNLYYGHVEKDTFSRDEDMEILGLTDLSSVIVRVMDDYLMISTRKDAVAHFLRRAYSCFKPFGGGFNPTKTKVNFDMTLDINGADTVLPKISGHHIPWCGFVINDTTLEISPSFQKLLSSGIENSITRDCFHIGVSFRKALKGFIRPKMQTIILDMSVNSFETVTTSVYSIFLAAAVRADSYLRRGASSLKLSIQNQNIPFLSRCIREVINYGAKLVKIRGGCKTILDHIVNIPSEKLSPLKWKDICSYSFSGITDWPLQHCKKDSASHSKKDTRTLSKPPICSLTLNQVSKMFWSAVTVLFVYMYRLSGSATQLLYSFSNAKNLLSQR